MVSLYDYRWFIGGGGHFLQLHGQVKVAVSQFSPLEMVAMGYFCVHFATTDKLDIATSMRHLATKCDPKAPRKLPRFLIG